MRCPRRTACPADVRAAGDHQAGAGLDRHVRERLGVAPVLAEVMLFLAGHVIGAGTFRASVHVDDDQVCLARPA